MTSSISPLPAAKLLVSIFSAMNPVCEQASLSESTAQIVREHMNDIGFDLDLPLKIKLADDYAHLFAYILNEVNDDDIKEYAEQKARHGANFGRSGKDSTQNAFHNVSRIDASERIRIAKTVIADMSTAKLIEVSSSFLPVIR
tara:strand:+ start:239034 stop:239462 length:429 start_codon:yes stop_codon:yes gene_type:complete